MVLRDFCGSRFAFVTGASGRGAGTAATIRASQMPGPTVVAIPSLRHGRIQRALPQRQLAERAGLDIATVQRLEAGQAARLSTIGRLAEVLGVSPGDLMAQPSR